MKIAVRTGLLDRVLKCLIDAVMTVGVIKTVGDVSLTTRWVLKSKQAINQYECLRH